MSDLVLLIRGPKKLWPMINHWDNFMQPQNFLCLAAYLEENGIPVKIIDCCINKWGWKSTKRAIEKTNPTIVGIGEPITWADDGIRVLQIAKEVNKDILTIAGGPHYFNIPELYLYENSPCDMIVAGEGELTLHEIAKKKLNNSIKTKENWKDIKGILFFKNGNIIRNPPRALIEDLDSLPLPAYHLIPMHRYTRERGLWEDGVTIHHSRGCIGDCKFCSCWVSMSEKILQNNKYIFKPKWRTKSPERVMEEIKLLYDKYKKSLLIWVDDCWNANKKWTKEFCDLKIEWDPDINVNFFAFLRSDFIVRDDKSGLMDKVVDAGLSHAIVGVERAENEHLDYLNKKGYTDDVSYKAFKILQKYPQVFRQGTFVTGIWEDNPETFKYLLKYARKLGVEYPAFHTITPHPGTELWNEVIKNKRIKELDFSNYTWYVPITETKYMTRQQIAQANQMLNVKFLANPVWVIKGLFSRYRLKRWKFWWFLRQSGIMFTLAMLEGTNPFRINGDVTKPRFFRLIKPSWYDS